VARALTAGRAEPTPGFPRTRRFLRMRSSLFCLVFAALVLGVVLSGLLPVPAGARPIIRGQGGAGGAGAPGAGSAAPAFGPAAAGALLPFAEASPVEAAVLEFSAPLAADGAGNLLTIVPAGDGYAILRRVPAALGTGELAWEIVYRRKGVRAAAIAVGPGGTICTGWSGGLECIDPHGHVAQFEDELLIGTIAVTVATDGYVWALRSTSGGTTDLQLVRVDPGLSLANRVLTLRNTVQGFPGNGLAAGPSGSVLLPVIENDIHRVLRVEPTGQFARLRDFFRLGGGIAVDYTGAVFVPGVKRPQSAQEQRNPQDVLFVYGEGISTEFAARFPLQPGGAVFSGHMALGGDGTLHLTRRQQVLIGGVPQERYVLWQVPVGRAGMTAKSPVIDFRIPFLETVANPRFDDSAYAGPVMVTRGELLALSGLNFEGKQGQRRVLVDGQPVPVQLWSDDAVFVRIPFTAPAGPVLVQVAIDDVVSNVEAFEIKTPEVPGWFQVGSPADAAALSRLADTIRGYTGVIVIDGVTDAGEPVRLETSMITPGLFHTRLPNGQYTAEFSSAYLIADIDYGPGFIVTSSFNAVVVPRQEIAFRITDISPIFVWRPVLMGPPPEADPSDEQEGQ